MTKILPSLLFFFFCLNIMAQNKIEVTFKDGSTINGVGRIKDDERIVYRKEKGAERIVYDYKTVKKLKIFTGEGEKKFEYKIFKDLSGSSSNYLLEVLKTGKVNFYQDHSTGSTYTPDMMGNGGGFSSYSRTIYYISKPGNTVVTSLRVGNTYSRRFRKIAKIYFSDCTDLMEKINTKHFKRYGIESLMEYYYERCN